MTFSAARAALATVNFRSLTSGIAIPLIEATAQRVGTSSNAIADRPTGTVDGDLLIVLQGNDSIDSVSQSSGFTNLFSFTRSDATRNHRHSAWWKIASSEPATWSFTLAGNEEWDTFVYRISGHDPTTPIIDVDWTTDIIGVNVNIPAVTSEITNCLLIHSLMGGGSTGATFVAPGDNEIEDYNLTGDGGAGIMVACAHEPISSGGGTGIRTWTLNHSGESRSGAHIYVQPVAGQVARLELEGSADHLLFEDSSGVIELE